MWYVCVRAQLQPRRQGVCVCVGGGGAAGWCVCLCACVLFVYMRVLGLSGEDSNASGAQQRLSRALSTHQCSGYEEAGPCRHTPFAHRARARWLDHQMPILLQTSSYRPPTSPASY